MQILLLLISVFFTGCSQLLFRRGMKAFSFSSMNVWEMFVELFRFILVNPYIWGGLVCMGIGGMLWLYSLSRVEVSFAYPFVACSFILVMVGGYVLGEQITLMKTLGVGCILLGIVFISRG
ncbi:MAG: EamA family transporter [Candidatus Peribacteria bacterium]|jgi:drug/metabolite transporter (DMT)-like permease|nr:EamA family transporter [Candidatus Peribacteria bacterium]